MFLVCLRAPAPRHLRHWLVVAAGLAAVVSSVAQPTTPASPAASAPAAELTPAERAKRDAEKVFHWITIHGDKPRKAVTKDEKPPTVVRVRAPAPAPTATPAAPALAANLAAPKPEVGAAASASAPAASALPPAAPASPAVGVQSAALTALSSPPASRSLGTPAAAPITSAPAVAVEDDASDTLVPVTQPEPKFPINLVRTLRAGQVQVQFTVQPDGSVVEPTVVASSNPRLNPAALAAVGQWRFAPVRKPQQGIVELGFTAPD